MKNIVKILVCLLINLFFSCQKKDDNIILLHTWKIENKEEYIEKTKFTYTEKEKVSNFYLEYSNNAIILKDSKTNKVVNKFPFKVPNPSKSCELQEKEQLDDFNKNVFPTLLKTANENCNPVIYCIQYFCNNNPTKAVILLVPPNSKSCKWSSYSTKSERKKYNFNLTQLSE